MPQLAYTIDIARPVEDVFDVVADPRNDHRWCERVRGCEAVDGGEPRVGARYEVEHRPSLHRAHTRRIEIVELDRPAKVVSVQEDQIAHWTISYLLEPNGDGGTRLTQRDDIEWRVTPIGRPIARRIVGQHLGEQLRTLKALLESPAGRSERREP